MLSAEWFLVIGVPAAVPLLAWLALFVFANKRSHDGRLGVRVNILAITGAFLALASFYTGWEVLETGGDWVASNVFFLFLLFTYPVAVITPLAGIGQAGMLVWVMAYAQEHDASITPYYGYVLAWVSVGFMMAGVVWPLGLPRDHPASAVYDRLLTMTVSRPSRPWMAPELASVLLFSSLLVAAGVWQSVYRRRAIGVGMLFLIVGLVFVWYMLQGSRAERLLKMLRIRKDGTERGNEGPVRVGHSAWAASLLLAYVAAILLAYVAVGVFVTNDIGRGGEQAMSVIVQGVIALVAGVAGFFAYRHATAPKLPSSVTIASVALFSSFIILASLGSAFMSVTTGLSVRTYLIFAGVALVGPAFFYMETRDGT